MNREIEGTTPLFVSPVGPAIGRPPLHSLPPEYLGIPYEEQRSDPPEDQRCGAASLHMIYQALGLSESQDEIWERIAWHDRRGGRCARTYTLAGDAIHHGFDAVVIQFRSDPWKTIQACRAAGIHLILNHRMEQGRLGGHFSVAVEVRDKEIILHDPAKGPLRRIERIEFQTLWQPAMGGSRVPGRVLVAIAPPDCSAVATTESSAGTWARRPEQPNEPEVGSAVEGVALATSGDGGDTASPALPRCEECQVEQPIQRKCRSCHRVMPLRPLVPFGCLNHRCGRRMWLQVFCPLCDAPHLELIKVPLPNSGNGD